MLEDTQSRWKYGNESYELQRYPKNRFPNSQGITAGILKKMEFSYIMPTAGDINLIGNFPMSV